MMLRGIHDDEYWKMLHDINPKALIPKAFLYAEKLTREEVEDAVRITGNFEIAERWCKANQFPKLYDVI